jgi:hypothetical protein
VLRDGVPLPDLVGLWAGPAILGRASHRGAGEPSVPEPSLEGEWRGKGVVGPSRLEWNSDTDGAPGGMIAFELASGLDQLGVGLRAGGVRIGRNRG